MPQLNKTFQRTARKPQQLLGTPTGRFVYRLLYIHPLGLCENALLRKSKSLHYEKINIITTRTLVFFSEDLSSF